MSRNKKKRSNNPATPKYAPTVEAIFSLAMKFQHAALTLTASMQSKFPVGGGYGNAGTGIEYIPQVVNSAFSLEMHLKCLMFMDTNVEPPYTHNLLNLYNSIRSDWRMRIKQYYDQEIASRPETAYLKSVGPDKNFLSIQRCLSDAADAFETWRYWYGPEYPRKTYNGQPVRNAANLVILELRPDLQPIANAHNTPPKYPIG